MTTGPLTKLVNAAFCWPKNRKFAEDEPHDKCGVRVFVLQHAPCVLPPVFNDREVYVPIQCGRALHETIEGAVGDDTGESISNRNAEINEMTAIWWVGKHLDELGDFQYVGFSHYRRWLSWSPCVLGHDAVLACKVVQWQSLRRFFGRLHSFAALELYEKEFRREFGDDEARLFARYLDGFVFYPCNCFLMGRDQFKRYRVFIDKCVAIALKLIDSDALGLDRMTPYQRRMFGFILERVTSYWIWREKRLGAIKVVGCEIKEFNIANKANSIR